jgi:GxxExxY protein
MRDELLHERITGPVIGAFFEVYNALRHGHLEACYQRALSVELGLRGIPHLIEAPIDVWYKGSIVGVYRADLLVEDRILVELKAGKTIDESAFTQTTSYLHATRKEVGLLLHFGPQARFYRLVNSVRGPRLPGERDPRRSA